MTQCPNCSKTIAVTEDNFGTLYCCEHCRAEFFIGFDGAPENSKQPLVGEIESNEAMASNNEVMPMSPITFENELISNNEDSYQNQMTADSSNLYSIDPSVDKPMENTQEKNVFNDFTQDVRDFGNDSTTSGILSFDLEISGIDLGQLKQDLLEALDDKRFGWNLSELSQRIQDGKLVIENVSAAKIIVLIKRITPIGLNLNWRHNVSTQ